MSSNNTKVLVVCPQRIKMKIMVEFLDRAGINANRIVEAVDASWVLPNLQACDVGMIISAHNDEIDALKLLGDIRKSANYSEFMKIPFAIITNLAEDKDVITAAKLGITGFLLLSPSSSLQDQDAFLGNLKEVLTGCVL